MNLCESRVHKPLKSKVHDFDNMKTIH